MEIRAVPDYYYLRTQVPVGFKCKCYRQLRPHRAGNAAICNCSFYFLKQAWPKNDWNYPAKNYHWLLVAFIAGLFLSFLLHYIGTGLYGNSYQNWYSYIGRSYKIPPAIQANDKAILFTIMALTGMTFSPIGQELFFRGIVHAGFARSIGETRASVVDSAAFALVHISHLGLLYVNNQWKFMTWPTLIWVLSMFLASSLFFIFKKYSGSILGAIICHAAFNLGMIYCIFYLL